MKKMFISAILVASAVSMNAQEYFINDNFSGVELESDYVSTPYLLQPNDVELVRNACNFEEIQWDRSTFESTDGKSEDDCPEDALFCGASLRVGDEARAGEFADFGFTEFTIPAGTSVGEIRIHVRGKGNATAQNREAVIEINGEEAEILTGMGSSFAKIFSQTLNEVIAEDMTIRIRSNNADPILINSIIVSLYESVGLNETAGNAALDAYFAQDMLNVANIAEGVEQISVYNLQGALVSSAAINGQTAISIPVSSLAKGTYVVKAGNETIKIQK